MEKRNLTLENSLLRQNRSSLLKYVDGWEKALNNLNEIVKEELRAASKRRKTNQIV